MEFTLPPTLNFPLPQAPGIHLSVSTDLPVWIFHINGIIQYMIFLCLVSVPQDRMCLRFTLIVADISTSFVPVPQEHFIVQICNNFKSLHPPKTCGVSPFGYGAAVNM